MHRLGCDGLADCRILQLSKRKFRAKTFLIDEDLSMIKNLNEKEAPKLLKEQKLHFADDRLGRARAIED